jgi:hypothetical protein
MKILSAYGTLLTYISICKNSRWGKSRIVRQLSALVPRAVWLLVVGTTKNTTKRKDIVVVVFDETRELLNDDDPNDILFLAMRRSMANVYKAPFCGHPQTWCVHGHVLAKGQFLALHGIRPIC